MSTSANFSSASAFRSLRNPNYRLWATGAFVSNVGTWMQRTAQDWLVLAELTPHSGTAVGIVMALQFGPSLVLLPLTGLAADVFDRRKLLVVTQSAMGALEQLRRGESLDELRSAVKHDPKFAQAWILISHLTHDPDEQVLRGIQITINGISAGLRNSG